MLPIYIIEEIKRRKAAHDRVERPQPRVELPQPPQRETTHRPEDDRGVVIIPIF